VQAKQAAIQKAINTAKAQMEKAEQQSRSRGRATGRLIPAAALAALTSVTGTAAFRLFAVSAADIGNPVIFYSIVPALMAGVGFVIYEVTNLFSGERIDSYFVNKCMNHAKKYDAIRKVLDHLDKNKTINLSNEELNEIEKDPKQMGHLIDIAAAGSKEALVVVDQVRIAVGIGK
jgi:hypothetical protein